MRRRAVCRSSASLTSLNPPGLHIGGSGSDARRSSSVARAAASGARQFDYFVLARKWPGTYCSRNSCPLVQDLGRRFHFIIHGLWPNYADGTWPEFCDRGYKLDYRKLGDLIGDLAAEWPSVVNSDEMFWEHEWSKHGTCALSVIPTERSFFRTVLNLHWRYDLAAALHAAGILPRDDTVYRKQDLVNAIEKMYGVRPLIQCHGTKLSEIWMFFDKDLRPINCVTAYAPSCGEDVTIPPFKPHLAPLVEPAVA